MTDELLNRKTYRTDIGPMCMSQNEHARYLALRAEETPRAKAARLKPYRLVKAVVFDMDGVIFDSERLVLKSWKMVADRENIPEIEETVRKCLGTNREVSRRIFLEAYGEDFPYDTLKQEAAGIYHRMADGGKLPLMRGVRELLGFLREEKRKIALASSTREEVVVAELRDAGLLEFFDEVVCGDMLQRSKPEPDIYLMACERIGVDPKEAYAVEDSYNGIRSAYAAGMHPVMVPDMMPPTEEMEEKSEIILTSLEELQDYFRVLFA